MGGYSEVSMFSARVFLPAAGNEARTESNARNRNEAQRDTLCENDVPVPAPVE